MKKIIFFLLLCNIAYSQDTIGRKFTIGVRGQGGGISSIDSLDNLLDVTITSPSLNQILKYDGSQWVNGSIPGTGTVTSVGAFQPFEGLTISGSPITSAGNLTFALANDLLGLENLASTGIAVRNGTSSWVTRSVVNGKGTIVNNGDGTLGNISIDTKDSSATNELQNISWSSITATTATATLSNSGGDIIFRAGANTLFANVSGGLEITATGGGGGSGITSLSMAQPASGFTITPTTLSAPGTFTFALNNDLLALENLGSTGLAVRTGVNSWANRIITGSGGITVSNGDGVAGNINISFSGGSSITGSGTANRVSKWITTTSLGDGIIQDNGSTIGIGIAPSSYLTQWNAGDIRIGTGDATQRVVFGDDLGFGSPRVSIGEEGATDRLTLRGTQLALLIGGSPGSNGQVLTSNGTTASWATPSGGGSQIINWSGTSSSVNLSLTGGNITTINAGTNVSFSSISTGGFTINATGGGGGTMTMPGSLIFQISGVTGSVDFEAGLGMGINLSGTSTNSVLTFQALDISPSNELQSFSTVGNTSTLSNSGGSLTFTAGANMTITNTGTSLNPNYLFTSAGGGGGTTDLSWINTGTNQYLLNNSTGTDVTLNFNSGGLSTSLVGSVLNVSALDQSATNEIQILSLASNIASLSNGGGSINLSAYLDNTDNQSFSTTGLIASLSGASTSIGFDQGTNISITNIGTSSNPVFRINAASGTSYLAGTGISIVGNTISNTGDLSNTNEAQSLTFASNIITLSTAGGSGGGSVNLSSYIQNLSLVGQSLGISGGGTGVTLPVINVSSGSGISVSNVSGNYIVNNTGDLSSSNEGILSVGAGGSNSATLSTNTSGSGTVNITAGTGISIIETTGTNGTIEISATSSGGISGTINQIPKFITSTTIGNSIASEIFSSPGTYFRINSSTGFSNVLPLYFPLQPANGTNGEALYIGPDGTVRKNQSVILNSDGTNLFTVLTSIVILSSLPTFNSDAAASSLQPGQVYKTTTGELRIKL